MKKEPPTKPVATASIKQATSQALETPEPTTNGTPASLETSIRLPDNHIKLRSIPSRIFRRWPDLRDRCNQDDSRTVAWTSKRTLVAIRREFEARVEEGKGGKAFENGEEVPVEVFRCVGVDAADDGDEEKRREVKRVKVVLKSCTGMSDGDVALWPPVFDSGSGTLGDWEKLGFVKVGSW